MDHLIGQRFSLISKSEIRYVGTLHEINPEQSTIALEEVFSFGTEDRPVDNYIPPSPQKFEYIVFRGSDVKDIKIDEEAKEPKQPSQPPNDPAILNSSRPGPAQSAQPPPPGPPSNRGESPFPPPNFGAYYGGPPPPGPPPGQFGRGYGPPPGQFGPGPGYPPYGPPPPGYFGPPGQGFPPQGPNRIPPHQQHPPPIGPPGQRPPPPNQQHLPQPGPPPVAEAKQTTELPEKNTSRNASKTSTPAPPPAPAQMQKPTDVPPPVTAPAQPPPGVQMPPTQPKSNRVAPAMPFVVNKKTFTPPVSKNAPPSTVAQQPPRPVKTQAEMEEASRLAKEVVATTIANYNAQAASKLTPQTTANMDAITEQMGQMNAGPSAPRGRGGHRGGRGARASSGQKQKMEIPQQDFDFESANAKFNKGDLIKEAIASGSPLAETSEDPMSASGIDGQVNGTNGVARKDSFPQNPVPAYNKASSFFDNISSEAKDREDSSEGRFNPRAQRGAEFKKNVETFGQGNVDSGYRGRGRGGYRGRGRGNYNRNEGYRGGYRGRGRGVSNAGDGTAVVHN